MKYGDSLQKRSHPSWQTHNIDYQDIKHLIRANTTPAAGKAVNIPGSADQSARKFEDELFAILKEQDERITWFVRSKAGEIQRRLVHLEQQISRFTVKGQDAQHGRSDVKRVHRYGRIESDILKVGEEIQALSRYIGLQQEAFRKLIKKYKKWTGSSELGYRFDREIRPRPLSYTKVDLKPYLERYEELLHTVRVLYEHGEPDHKHKKAFAPAPNTHARARLILDKGRRVDFDHLLATIEAGEESKTAVYWVHPDNAVELQVLLQQYTRSFNARCKESTGSSGSSVLNSPQLEHESQIRPNTFDIIVDSARWYLTERASENLASADPRIQRAALHARCNERDDVSLLAYRKQTDVPTSPLQTCAVKRKFMDAMLGRDTHVLSRKASVEYLSLGNETPTPEQSLDQLRAWMKDHQEVTPITTISSQRARFFSASSSGFGITLVALDQHVQFEKRSDDARSFPFAVLTVRQEGVQSIDLSQTLDQSHLVERVHGFSLEHHATWEATQPADLTKPSWLPLLSKDIRKEPRQTTSPLAKSGVEFASQSTTPRMSTTGSSDTGNPPPEPRPANTRRATFDAAAKAGGSSRRKKHAHHDTHGPEPTRYWNEFDNPSDEEDDGYVIYVDPNYESLVERSWKSFKAAFSSKKSKGSESEPLLYSPDLESGHDDYESSDDEAEPSNYRISRIYGPGQNASMVVHDSPAIYAGVHISTLACFSASISILITAFVLAATGRRKLHAEVDAGVIFAVATSLAFAIAGVATLYRTTEQLRGIVWAVAGVILCAVAVACGGLLAWVLT